MLRSPTVIGSHLGPFDEAVELMTWWTDVDEPDCQEATGGGTPNTWATGWPAWWSAQPATRRPANQPTWPPFQREIPGWQQANTGIKTSKTVSNGHHGWFGCFPFYLTRQSSLCTSSARSQQQLLQFWNSSYYFQEFEQKIFIQTIFIFSFRKLSALSWLWQVLLARAWQ
jgi:hypothetical protein